MVLQRGVVRFLKSSSRDKIYIVIFLSLIIRLTRHYYFRNDSLNITSRIFLIILSSNNIANVNLSYNIVFYALYYFILIRSIMTSKKSLRNILKFIEVTRHLRYLVKIISIYLVLYLFNLVLASRRKDTSTLVTCGTSQVTVRDRVSLLANSLLGAHETSSACSLVT